MTSKYRNPGNNHRLTRQLFYETTLADKSTVLYTLKDQDHEGYPSLYRLYMECNDPTEWEFAQKYFEGWQHWEEMLESTWFKPYIARWRKELDLREKAEHIRRIRLQARQGGRDSLLASKYLMEKGWEPKGSKKPLNEKEEVLKKVEQEEMSLIQEQASRIGLKVVN